MTVYEKNEGIDEAGTQAAPGLTFHFWRNVGQRWCKLFLCILSDPILCSLIALLIFFIYLSIQPDQQSQSTTYKATIALLNFCVSIITGIVGAQLFKSYAEDKERTVLKTRGESAIRSLYIIQTDVAEINIALNEILTNKNSTDIYKLHGVSSKLLTLERWINNAIQDWSDIIPDVSIRPETELLSKLMIEKTRLEKKVQDVTHDLDKTKSTNQELIINNELIRELESSNKSLQETNSLVKKTIESISKKIDPISSNISFASGKVTLPRITSIGKANTTNGGLLGLFAGENKTCPYCKIQYEDTPFIIDENGKRRCPNCKKELP